MTGPNAYYYMKVTEDKGFEQRHALTNDEIEQDGGTMFTCHTWTKEHSPRLIVCNEIGEIILYRPTGEVQTKLR